MPPTRLPIRLLTILTLAACSAEAPAPTGLPADAVNAAKAGKPGGGGSGGTTYYVTVEGDVTMPVDGALPPTVTRSTSNPFGKSDLAVSDVSFELSAAPTGDVAVCAARSGFPYATHWNGNEGRWLGSVVVKGTGTLNLNGSRTVAGATYVVQSSTAPLGDPTVDGSGVWRRAYLNATQYFGSSSTQYDGLWRCTNITIVLTPVALGVPGA